MQCCGAREASSSRWDQPRHEAKGRLEPPAHVPLCRASSRAVAEPIPDPLIEPIGARLRLLALPLRIRIIDHLDRHGETNVQALTDHLGATQQNVSRHLRLLTEAAVLERRRDGRIVWYRLCDQAALRLIECAASSILYRVAPSEFPTSPTASSES